MRTLYVGDVHGCSVELLMLLKKFKFKKGEDKLYFTGDLIDKGYNNIRVMELFKEYDGKSVMGNHEQYFMEMYEKHNTKKFAGSVASNARRMDGSPSDVFLNKFHLNDFNQARSIYDVVKKFPLYMKTPDGILVHAGIDPREKDYKNTDKRFFTKIKRMLDGKPWFENYEGKTRIIFGHWSAQNYIHKDNLICLDTACVYGYHLTGWCPEEDKFYQVKSTIKEKWHRSEDRHAKKVDKDEYDAKNIKEDLIASML